MVDAALLRHLRSQLAMSRERGRSIDPMFEQIMRRANDLVKSWGGKLVVAYLPEWRRFAGAVDDDIMHTQVLAVLAGAGIRTIDVLPSFAAHADPLSLFPYRLYGHYTPEGYQLVGSTIVSQLAAAP